MDSNGFKLLHKENYTYSIYSKLIGGKKKEEAEVGLEREEEVTSMC